MSSPAEKKPSRKRNKRSKQRNSPANRTHDEQGNNRKRKRGDTQQIKQHDAAATDQIAGTVSSLSLASRLKRQRGTAESTPLPPPWNNLTATATAQSTTRSYLTPEDEDTFRSCWKQCYRGFHWEPPEDVPFHHQFDSCLDAFDHAGLFLYDTVQPGKRRLSRTMVTRMLIGDPGTTYRYLGLRLFSHPWSRGDSSEHDDTTWLINLGYSSVCANALWQLGQLNQSLVQRTQSVLQNEIAPHVANGLVGSADYTLTLVNKMEPTSIKKDLKREQLYNMGKTSVSWHKDSGLMDFSSIAVYHSLRDPNIGRAHTTVASPVPWRVALRVASPKDANTSTMEPPPLCIPLPSGSIYYLLDDFNHQHEHAVLSGSSKLRYSSTHRVARQGRGTWQYVREKCRDMLDKPAESKLDASSSRLVVKRTRAQQQLLTEIEFEWLRQWYIQGKEHARLHPYWHQPIRRLERWYIELHRCTKETIASLLDASKGQSDLAVSEALFDVMIEAFEERSNLSEAWKERDIDPVFENIPEDERPFTSSALDQWSKDDAHPSVLDIRKWRKSFVKHQGRGISGAGSAGLSDLTKKEKRKVASNWEKMKHGFAKSKK